MASASSLNKFEGLKESLRKQDEHFLLHFCCAEFFFLSRVIFLVALDPIIEGGDFGVGDQMG